MATMIQRNFSTPKSLVIATVLLWLLVSIPLWLAIPRAQAEHVSDTKCNPASDPTYQVQNEDKLNPVYDNCFHVYGRMVYSEWWRGCSKWGWACYKRDGDFNFYMYVDEPYKSQINIEPTEVKNLQRYKQAQREANFLTETIPYDRKNDGDSREMYGYLAPPCMDSDLQYSDHYPYDARSAGIGPCKGQNIYVHFVGTLDFDSAHIWKEVHPVKNQYR